MNLPTIDLRQLAGNLEEIQLTPLHDGNILSVDFYCVEDVNKSSCRQKLGGASYDTF